MLKGMHQFTRPEKKGKKASPPPLLAIDHISRVADNKSFIIVIIEILFQQVASFILSCIGGEGAFVQRYLHGL